MASNPGEDPLSRLQSVVESADMWRAAGHAAKAGLSKLGKAGGAVANATKPILHPLTTAMAVLTVAVAIYLPLVPMTSQVLSSMSANPSPGIWVSAADATGGDLAYTLVLWRVIHFSFEILHTGPYWAMRVQGFDGEKGREERQIDAQGLKGSMREIGENTTTVFRGFGGGGGK